MHRLTIAEMPSHNHSASTEFNKLSGRGVDTGGGTTGSDVDANFGDAEYRIAQMNNAMWSAATLQSAGSNHPHNIMQPFMAVHWIMKI